MDVNGSEVLGTTGPCCMLHPSHAITHIKQSGDLLREGLAQEQISLVQNNMSDSGCQSFGRPKHPVRRSGFENERRECRGCRHDDVGGLGGRGVAGVDVSRGEKRRGVVGRIEGQGYREHLMA